jgi:hypothetical protein
VFHDSICADARFNTLLQRALEAGAPLTREKVEAVFGPVRWDDNAGWKHTGGNEAKNVG